jgi:hypothetical protein
MPIPIRRPQSADDWRSRASTYVLQIVELIPQDRLTLQQLFALADEAGARSLPAQIVTSATVIAAAVGRSERTAQRSLRRLEAMGYVRRLDTLRGRGLYLIEDPADVPGRLGVVVPDPQQELPWREAAPTRLSSAVSPPVTTPLTTGVSPAVSADGPPASGADAPRTRTPARALPATADLPAPAPADDGQIRDAGRAICQRLFGDGRPPLSDVRDRRLVYQLAVLLLDHDYAAWIDDAIAQASGRGVDRPWASVQRVAQQTCPGTPAHDRSIQSAVWRRLLHAIHVPAWALDASVWRPDRAEGSIQETGTYREMMRQRAEPAARASRP